MARLLVCCFVLEDVPAYLFVTNLLSGYWKDHVDVFLCAFTVNSFRATIIDYLKQRNNIVVYYFFNFANRTGSEVALLRHFLAQLFAQCQTIPVDAIAQLPYKDNDEFDCALDLIRLFVLWAAQCSPVYVVLDALDECGSNLIEAVISLLEELSRNSIRVLVSSRSLYEDRFRPRISPIWKVTMSAGTSDIYDYVTRRVAEDKRISSTLAERIRMKLKHESTRLAQFVQS